MTQIPDHYLILILDYFKGKEVSEYDLDEVIEYLAEKMEQE